MSEMPKHVVAYIRVSTEEQAKHGFSIPAQKKVLRDFAAAHGLRIVREFVESESAFKARSRPVFREMIEFLRQHRDEVGAVLCYKIDRITRNLTDFAELTEVEGIELISATEPLPDGSTGEMIAGIQAVVARNQSRVTAERVSLGMREKAEKGMWPSLAPIGYLNDKATKTIVPDSKAVGGICQLFEAYASGRYTLDDAAKLAREVGLRGQRGGKLSKSQVHWILTNPIYYGDFVWKGKLYHGTHQPLIARSLFDRVQDRLTSRSSPREQREFPYRGLLTCGFCGCNITAERHEKNQKEYIYYRCTNGRGKCEQPWVNQQKLGERLAQVVRSVQLTEEQVDYLLRRLRRDSEERIQTRKRRIQELEREKRILEGRRDDAYIDKQDGKLAEERWLRLDREWEKRIEKINGQIALLGATTEPRLDEARRAFELLQHAPELYLEQSASERAELLHELVSNCEMSGENLVPVYHAPFDAVAIGLQTGDWYARQDSNL